MKLEDYGIKFSYGRSFNDSIAKNSSLEQCIRFLQNKKSSVGLFGLLIHGEQVGRIKILKVSSKIFYIYLAKVIWKKLSEPQRKKIQQLVPNMTDHGKIIIGVVKLKN